MAVRVARTALPVVLGVAGLVLIGWGVWRQFGATPVLVGAGVVLLAMGWTMDDGRREAEPDGERAP